MPVVHLIFLPFEPGKKMVAITEANIKERVREEIGKIKSIMREACTIIQLYIEPVQHMSCLSIIFEASLPSNCLHYVCLDQFNFCPISTDLTNPKTGYLVLIHGKALHSAYVKIRY